MRTTFDIVDAVYDRLNNSSLTGAISGGLYKYSRPIDSKVEDVVINSLPINNLQLQTAVANVNIIVPNPVLMLNGKQTSEHPNHVRLIELADLAIERLKDFYHPSGYYFDVQQQNLFIEGSDSYINIRIDFYSENT